jgi:hypothetical protein
MARTLVIDPVTEETLDLETLERAWQWATPTSHPAAPAVKDAQLTISRNAADDFQDRQIYLFVDDEPWGKIRYGQAVTRDVSPGRHSVRAFNTLFSRTLEIDAKPGEHIRLACANGMPAGGWVMMVFLHVTYLAVRLVREA